MSKKTSVPNVRSQARPEARAGAQVVDHFFTLLNERGESQKDFSQRTKIPLRTIESWHRLCRNVEGGTKDTSPRLDKIALAFAYLDYALVPMRTDRALTPDRTRLDPLLPGSMKVDLARIKDRRRSVNADGEHDSEGDGSKCP